jgi:hypothetical protein
VGYCPRARGSGTAGDAGSILTRLSGVEVIQVHQVTWTAGSPLHRPKMLQRAYWKHTLSVCVRRSLLGLLDHCAKHYRPRHPAASKTGHYAATPTSYASARRDAQPCPPGFAAATDPELTVSR